MRYGTVHISPQTRRRALLWFLGTLAVVLGVIVTFPLLVRGDTLRDPLAQYFATRTGRQIRIDGPLELHLLAANPTVIARHVVVGNPPWSGPGNLAEIDTLTVAFDLPSLEIHRLVLAGATVSFQRDKEGHGNWLWNAPGVLPGDEGLPVIHNLSIPAAHLLVADDRRHLQFDGTLSTEEWSRGSGDVLRGDSAATEPLRITAKGQLNGHEVTIAVDADPLATATRAKPYHFTFDERSSGVHLSANGTLTHAYDLRYVDAEFSGSGDNLHDSYYLVGTNLPTTGAFRVSGKFARRNAIFKLTDVGATIGESDARVNITSRLDDTGHSHVDIDLFSRRLRLADLGEHKASDSRDPTLPDTPLHLDVLRDKDTSVNFDAEELDLEKFSFRTVTAKVSFLNGTLTVSRLSGRLADGETPAKITAQAELDARARTPTAKLSLGITNLRLGQFARKDPAQPPVDGPLQVRASLTARGRSPHDLAASADGTITAALAQGTIRASLAELAGVDLRGLGLTLTRNKKDAAIRCGVASFRAHNGTLTSERLVLDTDPVLITGAGTIQLDTQALDLQLTGQPKELRILRLDTPVAIQGTFAHPTLHIEGHKKLKLVDPGHARDADCGSLLAEAKATEPASW
jgi:AsmA family protein